MQDQKKCAYLCCEPFVYSREPPRGVDAHTHSFFDTLETTQIRWQRRRPMLVKLVVTTATDVPTGSVLMLTTSYGCVAYAFRDGWSICDPLYLQWTVPVTVAAYETPRLYFAVLTDGRTGQSCNVIRQLTVKRVFDEEAPPLVHCCVLDLLEGLRARASDLERALRAIRALTDGQAPRAASLEYSERHFEDRRVLAALRPFLMQCV